MRAAVSRAILRQRRHHALGVAGGDADVAFRLDLGRGVDVAHRKRAGMLRLERAQLLAGNHVGHRTARRRVRNEHDLGRIQDGGRLGHEIDAAEDDHVCLDLRGLARQLQRVAGEVGNVLHLRPLVVVREDDGVALRLQRANLRHEAIGRRFGNHVP